MSIVTITFSPCIDKSATVSSLVPEKKLQCNDLKLEPGGGGINVARAIKKLNGEATAIFPSGGYTGKYFNKLLSDEAITSVIIEAKCETRENIIINDHHTRQQYRFGMPGAALSEDEWSSCLKALDQFKDIEFIVASGSLPPGVPMDVYAQIAKIAKEKKAKLVVDTSGEALKHAVNEGVYLLKPNLGELSALVGKEELETDMLDNAAMQLIEKGNCEIVVVSMGAAGARLITKDIAKTITPPAVKRKSTVGAGDSMVAGIVLSLSRGMDLLSAVQYGVSSGTAATLNAGTELCKLKDVERLYHHILKNNS